MDRLIEQWLNGHEQQLTLFENDDEINLHRNQHGLLISAQLDRSRLDDTLLEAWMRVSQFSLEYFQGALGQRPQSGQLWLLQQLPGGYGKDQLLASLETLLNQRDTCRAMTAYLLRPGPVRNAPSLRSH